MGVDRLRLLLDTHALLWWLADDASLGKRARAAIASISNTVTVSAASAWEIATKVRLGKLPGAEGLAADFAEYLQREGFEALPISMDHAARAGLLAGDHRDPFDRMLIAQAQAENLALVSNEEVFDGFGVRRVW
ncbi:MAG TPA: type II toxin-antitoxin system VapC family toxin [Bryobacteraceae bacterium]|jgi:PIN domain nuclease of toxin-antitoxin system|nr:type II toxin-antitoxin system VapC family toxin [Bryobacteraceae bacterium]